MDVDLHLHSTASDGTATPTEVVRAALAARLDVIALTDHDTVAGVDEATAAARDGPLEVIPALEVSSSWERGEIHILGYFVDLADAGLRAHERFARSRRTERMKGMIAHLGEQGVEVGFDAVLAAAGFAESSLGRPHLARALVGAGYVASVPEAFDRYIGDNHPAYIPTLLLEPEGAIEMIVQAGGIPVWAHPPVHQLELLLPRLVRAGLRGVEVYRPRNSPDRVRFLEGVVRSSGLVSSGGSDWHGPDDGALGSFRIDSREVAPFLALGGI